MSSPAITLALRSGAARSSRTGWGKQLMLQALLYLHQLDGALRLVWVVSMSLDPRTSPVDGADAHPAGPRFSRTRDGH